MWIGMTAQHRQSVQRELGEDGTGSTIPTQPASLKFPPSSGRFRRDQKSQASCYSDAREKNHGSIVLADRCMNADTRFVYIGLGGLIVILVGLALLNAL